MNIKELLDDAALLWMQDRRESALTLILIAAGATARKRYPRPCSDREAFTRFISDESLTITGLTYDMPIPLPQESGGAISTPLAEILYRHLRCQIVHEAEIPPNIRIWDPGLMLLSYQDPLCLPAGLFGTLAMAIQAAPENQSLFKGEKVWVIPSEAEKSRLTRDLLKSLESARQGLLRYERDSGKIAKTGWKQLETYIQQETRLFPFAHGPKLDELLAFVQSRASDDLKPPIQPSYSPWHIRLIKRVISAVRHGTT